MAAKILFRADAGPDIGYGHFIRTLALADMLKKDFECSFATATPTEHQRKEVTKVCPCISLPDRSFYSMSQLLKEVDVVVLDNYYFTSHEQLEVRNAGCKLVCIDDLHDRHFYADAIINQALNVTEKDYDTETGTVFGLGPEYALLRSCFLEEPGVKLPEKYACLVMMGGADPQKLAPKVVSILSTADSTLPIAVVVSSADKDLEEFNKPGIQVFSNLSGSEICDLMRASATGIFPASTGALEACAVRLPFVCGYFTDNQLDFYKGFKDNKLALCVGDFTKMDAWQLLHAVQTLQNTEAREQIIFNQRKCLDKQSKQRFIQLFKQL